MSTTTDYLGITLYDPNGDDASVTGKDFVSQLCGPDETSNMQIIDKAMQGKSTCIVQTTDEWEADTTTILRANDLGIETPSNMMKRGDGASAWKDLPYLATGAIPCGEYDNAVEYLPSSIVTYEGSSYISRETVIGVLPTDETKWMCLASKSVITTNTETTASGILKGEGGYVAGAVQNVDYALPPAITTVTLSTDWIGEGPYTQVVSIDGVGPYSKVDIQPTQDVVDQLVADGVTGIYTTNEDSVVTFYALGAHPSVELSIQVSITGVSTAPDYTLNVGVAILGTYATLDDLKADVPNPKQGDIYDVGTAAPYEMYMWDSKAGNWLAKGTLQGPQGEAGATGKDGNDGYTPVRGTDYWTEADIAEIKNYVDEAILGGAW